MGLEIRKLLIEMREQLIQVRGRALHTRAAGSQSPQRSRNLYRDHATSSNTRAAACVARAPSPAKTSLSMYLSNSAIFGGMGSANSYLPASTSVVFNPLPVMQSTVVSSGRILSCLYSLRAHPTVTPPAVSVKMPSVSASN